jgi:hypothetical protein
LYYRLFAEAYPSSFLSQLKLDSILLINNYEISLIACLTNVQKLDMTGSQLDDDHDIWPTIPHLVGLRVLILADLRITDRGLKKILLPSYDGRKLPYLRYLDLSGTGFTLKTLASLKHITQLCEVLFYSKEKHLSIESMSQALSPCFRVTSRPNVERVVTTGFGSELLDRWDKALATARRKRREAALPRPTFYGCQNVVIGDTGTSKTGQLPEKAVPANKIMFSRITKRTHDSTNPNNFSNRKRLKRQLLQLTDENSSDLLNIYR